MCTHCCTRDAEDRPGSRALVRLAVEDRDLSRVQGPDRRWLGAVVQGREAGGVNSGSGHGAEWTQEAFGKQDPKGPDKEVRKREGQGWCPHLESI